MNPRYFGVLEKMLQKIGPDGAASLPSIQFESQIRPMDYSHQGRLAFQSFLSSVALCSNLRDFNMDLTVCYVLGSDLDALKTLFLHDQEPRFSGLGLFANVLSSLPNLADVYIVIRQHKHVSEESSTEVDAFL